MQTETTETPEPNSQTQADAPGEGCALLTYLSLCIVTAGVYLILMMLWS